MFILDTNTLIYYFKGMGRVAERLLSHSPREIGVPTLVLYELEVGLAKSARPEKRRAQLSDMLAVVTLFPFAAAEARTAAGIRAALEKRGEPIGPYDILIAATALANQATLVTHNVDEFKRIEGLAVVDWYE
jgi:tRNA(fMet)-specific endonuclease VapC